MPAMPHAPLYIGGEWIDTDTHYEVRSPATEEVAGTLAKGTREHTERAVAAARAAFDQGTWRDTSPAHRAELLRQVADGLAQRADELARVQSRENGAPVRLAEAVHIGVSLLHLRYLADLADRYEFQRPGPLITPVLAAGAVHREPIGVCAAIVPWNVPLLASVWKIAPALAAGNTVVIKPDEQAPFTVVELVRECERAGLPPGVLNLVTGDGADVGAQLAEHPHVRKVAVTGCTSTGRDVMRRAAGNIKHVSLELGGKGPNIVLDDADLKAAVDGALFACFTYSGQACEAGTRLLLPDSLHDEFVERMIVRAKTLRLSDPLDHDTDLGPVISAQQRDRMLDQITQAQHEGARLALGGGIPAGPRFARGHWIEPTILTDVTSTMRIAQEEVFGPLLAVMRYRTVEEAIEIANGTRYGLSAGVWTANPQAGLDIAEKLEAGQVWINNWHVLPPQYPFGGCKQSGNGREGGPRAIDDYTEEKVVTIGLPSDSEAKSHSLLLGTQEP
ncbi:aldehyde dehydrogenase family protein [Streptomyces iconiensis]|uniref:Aldehyde dehydrogenase family protein n=1 Tax=Streptomyces iconiensis TaxID=1384038 RepID=A0ABT7A1C2_9ACTN|nr:aldehyde dehydrogenase family protein [Streptomyces iconiensis]MDJ1135143.1 aldehyde dehydrogenase family protein [Streptomyces iconiensis]